MEHAQAPSFQARIALRDSLAMMAVTKLVPGQEDEHGENYKEPKYSQQREKSVHHLANFGTSPRIGEVQEAV